MKHFNVFHYTVVTQVPKFSNFKDEVCNVQFRYILDIKCKMRIQEITLLTFKEFICIMVQFFVILHYLYICFSHQRNKNNPYFPLPHKQSYFVLNSSFASDSFL